MFESFNIPDTHRLITDTFEFVPGGGGYGRLFAVDGSTSPMSLDQIARNPRGDQVLAQFSGLAHRMQSDHWEVYAQRDGFERLMAGDNGGQLQTYSLLNAGIFSRFADTIIASACFKDSMLYQLWSGRGVSLQSVSKNFANGLRYHQHGNGVLVTIQYVLDDHWSKSKRDMVVDGGGTLGEAINSHVGRAFGDAPFVWMGNKDQSGIFDALSNATQLPNSPHGRNDFQQFHNVAVLSALNPPPTHFAFMDTLGVSGDALKTAHYRSAVYQAVMRTSIRNPLDITPKTVIVMDRPTAHWLADSFPGARIEQLNIDVVMPDRRRGRPTLGEAALSATDRVRRCRQKKRGVLADTTPNTNAAGTGSAVSYGSVFPNKFTAVSALSLELDQADDDVFIALLAELHQRVVTAKDDNFLISPATFDAELAGVDTQRGLENVTSARGIWLDFDDGDLRHADFAAVFPTLRFVAFNTYSSTAANNRWRAFIPTSRGMNSDEYGAVVEQLERKLVDQRWGDTHTLGRQHGLDASKMHAASLLYAPCQAADESGSFFHDHRQLPRTALDVNYWLKGGSKLSAPTLAIAPEVVGHLDRETVVDAIGVWRAAPSGSGHRAFFALAARLRRAGFSTSAVKDVLEEEAQHAHSPHERRREIAGVIAGLSGG